MSVSQFESMIWRECQGILHNRKMRKKDILAWSTGKLDGEVREGEIAIYCPDNQVNVIVAASVDLRPKEV